MLAVMGAGVADDSSGLTVLLLTLSMTLLAAMYLGFQINHLDISPNHAPVLMGFTNLWANLLSVLGPIVTPLIVTEPVSTPGTPEGIQPSSILHNLNICLALQKDASQWHVVFLSAAGVFFVANALFLLLGSAEIQPWNSKGLDTIEDHESGKVPSMPLEQRDKY